MTTLIYIYLIGAGLMAGATLGTLANDKAGYDPISDREQLNIALLTMMCCFFWPIILVAAFFMKEK